MSSPDSPDENDDSTSEVEQGIKHCSLFDISCYHEYAGHPYHLACAAAGANLTGNTWSWFCQPEQPSGHLYLWLWDPNCRKGETWQWCRSHGQ